MIGLLRGFAVGPDVVDVAGVGYLVTSLEALRDGEPVTLVIHTIVREDALDLYGFPDRNSRDLFLALNRTPGVGPRLAMTLLRTLGVPGCAAALAGKDTAALTKVAGVGPKKAQQILTAVTVPDALLQACAGDTPTGSAIGVDGDLIDALVGLGYDSARAASAIADVRATNPDLPPDRVIRASLARLAA